MERTHQSAKRKLASVAAAAVLVVCAFSVNTAFAGGFIGDIVKNVVPGSDQVVDQVEQFNSQTHVFEDTGTAIVEYLLP